MKVIILTTQELMAVKAKYKTIKEPTQEELLTLLGVCSELRKRDVDRQHLAIHTCPQETPHRNNHQAI